MAISNPLASSCLAIFPFSGFRENRSSQALSRVTRFFSRGLISLVLVACSVLGVVVAQAQPIQEEVVTSMSVNINGASAAELAAGLNGVGLSKAEAIVRYREQFGDFQSVDELTDVTGIGAATVERNRSVIVLSE